MRKPQNQPKLASLTLADREQLADWLRHENYNVVLERVVKPRPEGLDLDISKKPLQTFYAKVALMDLINARLPEDKRFTLAQFECLASADIHLLTSAEQEKVVETHAQILRTTADLASSAQSANELATLQRLADFPARAAVREQLFECRAQRMEIEQNKEQRAQAKAHREADMHTHKITLDLHKFEHKLQMDTFHQHIVTERLDLQKKSLALREKLAHSRLNPTLNPDLFPPSDPNPVHPENPVKNPDGSSVPLEDNSDRPKNTILIDKDGKPFTRFPTPNPLPYEIYLKNCAYTEKLLAGLVDPVTGRELDEPTASRPCNADKLSACLPATITPTDATPEKQNPQPNPTNPESPLETRHPELETPDLPERVNSYNIRRAEEYWIWRRHIASLPDGEPHPRFTTQHRHCPCGKVPSGTPCPEHENGPLGEFPGWFWTVSPHLYAYGRCLTDRNLPYRSPDECIPSGFFP